MGDHGFFTYLGSVVVIGGAFADHATEAASVVVFLPELHAAGTSGQLFDRGVGGPQAGMHIGAPANLVCSPELQQH